MVATLSDELRGLFEQIDARVPAAAELHAYFQSRDLAIKLPGPNLERPPWSTIVAPEDAFVEIGSEGVAGIRFGDDPRGYGAYAEIVVKTGTLAEVEAITGPLSAMPPRGSPYEALFVRPVIRGHRIPVYVVHDKGAVRSVTVQFDRG